MLDRFETFSTTIAQISRCVQKIKAAEMDAVGLKSTHVMCLYSLGKEPGGLTAAQLSRACKEDKAAISRSVGELTERGYTRQDAARPYRAKILLTEKGREAAGYVNRRISHVLDTVGEGLDEAQRAGFYAALSLISQRLEDYVREESAQ